MFQALLYPFGYTEPRACPQKVEVLGIGRLLKELPEALACTELVEVKAADSAASYELRTAASSPGRAKQICLPTTIFLRLCAERMVRLRSP